MKWRVKILWNPKMFTIFASTKGSFPLKEILRLREQRFQGSVLPGRKEQSKGRSFLFNAVLLSAQAALHCLGKYYALQLRMMDYVFRGEADVW